MKLLSFSTALVAAFLWAAPSQAAVCMKHKTLVTFLADRHAEAPRALGLVEDRGLMEVYVSTSGTWTIIMTTVQGVACILAAGDNWEENRRSFDPEY